MDPGEEELGTESRVTGSRATMERTCRKKTRRAPCGETQRGKHIGPGPAEFKLQTEEKGGQEAEFGDFLTSGWGGGRCQTWGRVKREGQGMR